MKKAIQQFCILCFGVSIILALCLSFNINNTTAFATSKDAFASSELEENDFADNKVTIALTKKSTRQFLEYEPRDFSEVNAIAVEDLTASTIGWVKKK